MIDTKPWGEINIPEMDKADVCVMGIPFDGAVSCGKGAALAPEMMRNLSRYLPPTTEEGLAFENLKVYDHGDVAIDLDWARYYAAVEEEALKLLQSKAFCLFLGGDHSVTIPLQRAFGRYHKGKKIGIIHFDSHSDICDEYDSHKWSHACTEKRAVDDVIAPKDLSLIGIRSWEVEEIEYLAAHPEVLLIKAHDVHKKGYENVCQRLKEKYSDYDAVYLTLDIDVLDPSCAPGTGTPEAGGLESREMLEIIKYLISELPITTMDLVEVSPPLDSENNITSWTALKIIYEVFGKLSLK
ncbi:agmatinase [Bacillota bacterium]